MASLCISCFQRTKYFCLGCKKSVCNKCAFFESNEDTNGWIAGKSVGYCDACHLEFQLFHQAEWPKPDDVGENSTANSGRYVHCYSNMVYIVYGL